MPSFATLTVALLQVLPLACGSPLVCLVATLIPLCALIYKKRCIRADELALGDSLHGCLPRASLVQGCHVHFGSARRRMAGSTRRLRQLRGCHQYLRGWEWPAYAQNCRTILHLPSFVLLSFLSNRCAVADRMRSFVQLAYMSSANCFFDEVRVVKHTSALNHPISHLFSLSAPSSSFSSCFPSPISATAGCIPASSLWPSSSPFYASEQLSGCRPVRLAATT